MIETPSDAALLERFARSREEEAFATLVRRHGPRVERVCRRILRDERDVEDVIQAVFLVLASKAEVVAWRDSAAGWLAAVAQRLALAARSDTARLRAREASISSLTLGSASLRSGSFPERFHPAVPPSAEVDRHDLREIVEQALDQLPEKYKTIVRLCDLEGKTHDEAARGLGWPKGTTSRRLDRARALLRGQLRRHGVTLLIGLGFAVAALSPAGRSPRSALSPSTPGKVFAAAPDHAAPGLLLGNVVRDPSRLDDVQKLASQSAEAAVVLERGDSDTQDDHWLEQTHELRDAAQDLARIGPDGNPQATLAATRRLESACIRCHLASRD